MRTTLSFQDDAPLADWRGRVVECSRLGGHSRRFLYDEHEQVLPGDPEQVVKVLGVRFTELKGGQDLTRRG